MKKTLLDKATAEKIIDRVQPLQPGTQNLWGQMNASEMLLHCNIINSQILEDHVVNKKTTLKHLFFKYLILYITPNFPKHVRGKKSHDAKGKISSENFEEEKKKFIDLVRKFSAHQKPISLFHPFFGNLNTKEWGIAAWKHLDHHLRQFGL